MPEIMIYDCDKISDKYLVEVYFFYDESMPHPHLKRYVRQVVDLNSGHRVVRTEYDESHAQKSAIFVDGQVLIVRPRIGEAMPYSVGNSGYSSFCAKFLEDSKQV